MSNTDDVVVYYQRSYRLGVSSNIKAFLPLSTILWIIVTTDTHTLPRDIQILPSLFKPSHNARADKHLASLAPSLHKSLI